MPPKVTSMSPGLPCKNPCGCHQMTCPSRQKNNVNFTEPSARHKKQSRRTKHGTRATKRVGASLPTPEIDSLPTPEIDSLPTPDSGCTCSYNDLLFFVIFWFSGFPTLRLHVLTKIYFSLWLFGFLVFWISDSGCTCSYNDLFFFVAFWFSGSGFQTMGVHAVTTIYLFFVFFLVFWFSGFLTSGCTYIYNDVLLCGFLPFCVPTLGLHVLTTIHFSLWFSCFLVFWFSGFVAVWFFGFMVF